MTRRQRPMTEPLMVFMATLLRHRYPRSIPAIAAEVGISRATGYRWVHELERLAVVPLRRMPDPTSATGMLVGIDWAELQGNRCGLRVAGR